MVSINYQGTIIKPALAGAGLLAGIIIGTSGNMGFLKTSAISLLLGTAGYITATFIVKK